MTQTTTQIHDWEYNAGSRAKWNMILREGEISHIPRTRELKKQGSVDLHCGVMGKSEFHRSSGVEEAHTHGPYGIPLVQTHDIHS